MEFGPCKYILKIIWKKISLFISSRKIESIDRIPSWTGIGRGRGDAHEVIRHVQSVVGVVIMAYVNF